MELLKNLTGHDDLFIHVAGWTITIAVACGTILYKGIWKRVNQVAELLEDTKTNLDRLIGEHRVRHDIPPPWDGVERRVRPR